MTTMKQDIRISEYYEQLQQLPDRFKLKQVKDTIDRSDLHTLRCADIIVELPDAMGKETIWTIDDEIEQALDEYSDDVFREIPQLSNDQIYFAERHEELFEDEFQELDEEETFLARELDLKGRTPEGMDKYGFINKARSKSGYATTWELSRLGRRLARYKKLKNKEEL